LEVPARHGGLEGLLGALRSELVGLHRFRSHPFQQSVRGGSQLPLNAAELARPPIRALFESICAAAARHLQRVGQGSDPFRARNTGHVAITGAWSVRLASGGHHTDHVHPRGWLSSAFYVAVPSDLGRAGPYAGWLRLGQPGIATPTPQSAE